MLNPQSSTAWLNVFCALKRLHLWRMPIWILKCRSLVFARVKYWSVILYRFYSKNTTSMNINMKIWFKPEKKIYLNQTWKNFFLPYLLVKPYHAIISPVFQHFKLFVCSVCMCVLACCKGRSPCKWKQSLHDSNTC